MAPRCDGWFASSSGSELGARRDTGDCQAVEILDVGPRTQAVHCANMLIMNPQRSNISASSPRRFILLQEESVDGHGQRPRIRRYQLTSVGQRPGVNGVDVATARIRGDLDCPGHV